MPELTIDTKQRTAIVDITKEVSKHVGERSGKCLIFARHTTCGILCCTKPEAERMVMELEKKIPADAEYQHGLIDRNAHAHLRAILAGCEKVVPVRESMLALGDSHIFLVEFDGPQSRNIEVKVV